VGAVMKLLLGIQLVLATNFLRDRCFIRVELPQKSKRIDVHAIVIARINGTIIWFAFFFSICISTDIVTLLLRQC
jgi:hypothetical protein